MMSSASEYRINAEDCLRMASQASEDRDKPLWITMAQSWLRLAELTEHQAAAYGDLEPVDGSTHPTAYGDEEPGETAAAN
jgi:hypothetical protein